MQVIQKEMILKEIKIITEESSHCDLDLNSRNTNTPKSIRELGNESIDIMTLSVIISENGGV
jgi:hypothetical protein